MTSFDFRRKLLISLLSLAILLVAVKILLQNISESSSPNDLISENEIRQKFSTILHDFSIEQKLIKEKRVVDKSSGMEISSYKIQVPKDLTIPEILSEIYQTFVIDSLKINSIEKVKNGKTIVSLQNGKDVLLNCEFDYSKTYYRNKGYVSFLIKDVELSDPSSIQLLESSEKINFLLRPSSSVLNQLGKIQNYGQQFSVLIDDDLAEQKYELDPSHSEVRITTVIKTLVTDFQKAVCFIVDDNSSFYKSSNFEVFEKELLKRKIRLFTISDFVNLNNDETMIEGFNREIESMNPGASVIFLMNEDSYFSIVPDIKKFKKQGYRFIASSLILQN
ncbi:MAG: hypothetical protein IPM14_06445 [bacterium]|nr:hypothetical protein [bacterium]